MEKGNNTNPNSTITLVKNNIYNTVKASWEKYGKVFEVEAHSDIEALRALIMQYDNNQQIEEAKMIQDLTKDPKAQQIAITQAIQIDDLVQSKWFRVDELTKQFKNKVSDQSIIQALNNLQLFGLVVCKTTEIGVTKYKITLSREVTIGICREMIDTHTKHIQSLNEKIDELNINESIHIIED